MEAIKELNYILYYYEFALTRVVSLAFLSVCASFEVSCTEF